MVINENAIYQKALWCSYELKDSNGNYKEELRLHMRMESQKNQFTCPDCGEPLILCAGPVMEPFFKHYDGSKCITQTEAGKKRNLIAMRMLYHLVRESFPGARIEFHQKVEDIYTDILVSLSDTLLAVNYLGHEIKLEKWQQQHDIYIKHNIKDIWFLNIRKYPNEVGTTFEYLLKKASPIIKYIDCEKGQLILKESCELFDHSLRLLTKDYFLSEVRMTKTGELICGYYEYRTGFLSRANNEIQLLHQLAAEEMRYLEEIKQENYRKGLLVKSINQKSAQDDTNLVMRRPEADKSLTKNTMKMTAIGELWDIPILTGAQPLVKTGNLKRYAYLKKLNEKLASLETIEEQDVLIEQAIQRLEGHKSAKYWK